MPFDPQPTLAGELVEARPLRPDDFDEPAAVAARTRRGLVLYELTAATWADAQSGHF